MTIGTAVGTALAAGAGAIARTLRGGERFRDAHDPTRTHRLSGPLLERYRAEDGPAGALGHPVGDPRPARTDPLTPIGADVEVRFERGAIFLHRRSGSTTVVRW